MRVNGGPQGARVSAFLNEDGRVVVHVIQGGAQTGSVSVKVRGVVVGKAEAWITDSKRDCEGLGMQVEGDGSVGVNVPGKSMVTLVMEG